MKKSIKKLSAVIIASSLLITAANPEAFASEFFSDTEIVEDDLSLISEENESAPELNVAETTAKDDSESDYERSLLIDNFEIDNPESGYIDSYPVEENSSRPNNTYEIPDAEVEIFASTSSDKWDIEYSANKTTNFSIDTSNVYKDSAYSIKITNSNYDCALVAKKFSVKPNTTYRFSAMAKCSDISLDPGHTYNSPGGACVGQYWTYNVSRSYADSEWKRLEYSFTTGADESEYTLALHNGLWAAKSSGTVWYSDVRLEEIVGEKTNEWNALCIILKKVDVKGLTYNNAPLDYYATYDDADVAYLKKYNDNAISKFKTFSNSLMKVKSVDTYSTDVPVTELATYDYTSDTNIERGYSIHAYRLDPDSKSLSNILDSYLDSTTKIYNMINIYAPLQGVAGDSTGTTSWLGLNGNYRGIPFTVISSKALSGDGSAPATVHELLHQLEYKTQLINPSMYVALHASGQYPQYTSLAEWYTAYMRGTVDGNKGIDPSLYKVYGDGASYKVIFGRAVQGQVIDVATPDQLKAAISNMKDPNTDYVLKITGSIQVDSIKFPKNVKSVTIEGNTNAKITFTKNTSINAKCPLSFVNIEIVGPKPVKIKCKGNLNVLSANSIGSLSAAGKDVSVSIEDSTVNGNVSSAGNLTIINSQVNGSAKAKKKLTTIGDVIVTKGVTAKQFANK